MQKQNGFTKAEILISIVLLLIVGAVVWKAIDPLGGMAKERDNMRRSQVVAILNAVLEYQHDHNGTLPQGIDFQATTSQVLGTDVQGCDLTCGAVRTDRACTDLSDELKGAYLEELYLDPKYGTEKNSDYYINRTETGRVVVGVCDPEVSESISVVR